MYIEVIGIWLLVQMISSRQTACRPNPMMGPVRYFFTVAGVEKPIRWSPALLSHCAQSHVFAHFYMLSAANPLNECHVRKKPGALPVLLILQSPALYHLFVSNSRASLLG